MENNYLPQKNKPELVEKAEPDKYYLALVKAVEDMEKSDKTGLSCIDIMIPYQRLFNYCCMKGWFYMEK